MTLDSIITITIAVISTCIAPVVYLYRGVMQRINDLEESNRTKMSESEVRQLLDDKLESLRENVEDVKTSLDTLTTHILKLKK